MSDRFEKAKDDILHRTASDGGPTNADILVAMSALAEDGDDQHNESVHSLKQIRDMLAGHFREARTRDDRLDAHDAWIEAWEKGCPARLESAIEKAVAVHEEYERSSHEIFHEKHLMDEHRVPQRSDDPDGTDYSGDRRVWMMWTIGAKFTYVLLAVLITGLNVLVHWLLMGEP